MFIVVALMLGAVLVSPSRAAAPEVPPATPKPPFAQLSAAASSTTCTLQLEGYKAAPGLKSASLECSGAVLRATAAPQLHSALGPHARGINWTTSCSNGANCVLSICESSVTFRSPVIQNILVTDPGTEALMCIGDSSSVNVKGGAFTDWHSTKGDTFVALKVVSSSASLVVSNTKFYRQQPPEVDNNVGPFGGVLMAVAGQTTIVSSSCIGGHTVQGGAIVASDQAQVDIGSHPIGAPTTIMSSSALRQGGDMSVNGSAHVRVYDAVFAGAEAELEGSMHISGNSTVELYDTTIVNATALRNRGGIGVTGRAKLLMVGSTITNCYAERAVGGLLVSGQSVATLTNCNISNNEAGSQLDDKSGMPIGSAGGIAADKEARLILQDTHVTGNKAAYGGGMVINPDAQLLLQGDTRITGNEAWERAGGVNMLSNSLVGSFEDLDRATRNSNKAPHDPDIGLPVDKLQVLGTSSRSGNSTKEAFIPGDVLLLNVSIAGPNGRRSNQTVTVLLLNARNVSIYPDKLTVDASSGLQAVATARVMIMQPPGRYRVRLSTDNNMLANDNKTVDVYVNVVECPVGYTTASIDSCFPCVRGYFSFKPTDRECGWCPANAECMGIHSGQPQIWPVKGYWHSAPNSTQMHICRNPKACMPGTVPTRLAADKMSVTEYKTAQCSEGYGGVNGIPTSICQLLFRNLCGDCRLPSYGKVRPFVCRKCISRPLIIILYVVAVVAMMGLIKLLLYLEQLSSRRRRQGLQQALPEELLKVMVLHGQWLYIISYLVGVPWPATLAVPLQIVTGLWSSASGSSIGFECVLNANSPIPLGIQKELLCLLTPLAIMCVILVFEAVMHSVPESLCAVSPPQGRGDPVKDAKASDKLFSLSVCVVFLFLPVWLNSVFSLFTCVKLDDDCKLAQAVGSWWVHDMSQQCYQRSGYHRKWALGLGVPLLVLLCVVLPLAVFLFMWHSRRNKKLEDPAFIRHYGFMYRLWREGVCWWEAVVILQTAGLVMVSTLGFSLGPYRQSLVTCSVLGCVVLLLLWVRPFACRPANHVAVASACVLFITAYSALSFLPYDGDAPNPKYTMTMGVVILFANVLFLSVTCYKLVQTVDWATVNREVLQTLSQVSGGKSFMRPGSGSQPGSVTSSQLGGSQSVPAAPGLTPSQDLGSGRMDLGSGRRDLGSGRMEGPPQELTASLG